jgi:16S rRNA processing protein RimM
MKRTHRGSSEPDLNGKGSPNNGEPFYLSIGRLGKPHGLDGGIVFYIITDFPERLKVGRKVYIGDEHIPAHINSVKEHSRGLIFHFKEFDQIDQVERFKSDFVFVDATELPKLPEGEYYHHQLIGVQVFDNQDNRIGEIQEILETGANDVYLIKNEDQKEILYPALLNLIEKIDIENRVMVVKPLEYYNQD